MKGAARFFWSLFFLVGGAASFVSLGPIRRVQAETFAQLEPYFRFPVTVFSGMALIRNDSYGKGAFGVSRNGGRTHQGLDLLTPVGKPVFAAKSGRVAVAGWDRGYGFYLELRHPDGRSTRYAHLSKLQAQAGDWVVAGHEIGLAGKSGNANHASILPHLHFEVLEGGSAVDPLGNLLDPSITVR